MASSEQVRQYIAHWFQMGKPICLPNGKGTLLPHPVIQGDRYSPQFETIWQRLQQPDGRDAYLDGTLQTLGDLLSPSWEVVSCARCDMPVPMLSVGMRSPTCPCADVPSWPNTELPAPRNPVNSRDRLQNIRERLLQQ